MYHLCAAAVVSNKHHLCICAAAVVRYLTVLTGKLGLVYCIG